MLPYVLGALLLSAISVSADSKHECYWRRQDQVVIKDNLGWFQCKNTETTQGGAQLCCRNGDRCGDDSLCHTENRKQARTSWYVGGCSDGSYNDPVCRKDCTSFKQTYIQWNTSQHIWDCCGDYHCDSDNTSESFKAVSPAEWEPIPQTGDLGPNKSSGPASELSTGAIAGIAVACGAALIAMVTLIAVCCIRRRRPANKKWTGGNKGTYAKLGPQHEMQPQPYAGPSGARSASPMPRSRDISPAPASRGASPSRAPLVQGYGDGPPAYPDRLAATKDEGA